MLKKTGLACIILIMFAGAGPPEEFPHADITNGLIHARLYLPDAKDGYYRGSRFDWSGVIPDLEYNGHTYYGQWFGQYSPTLHDAIMGPVEDFLPIGYEEAKTGESFLKIGIGMVIKPDEPKYFIATPYQLVNPGTWTVKKLTNLVEFTHQLNDVQYAYEYKKTVELIKGKPEMVLSHTIKNTGKRIIETNVYDHNFLMMDKQQVGPGFVVTFPFSLTVDVQSKGDFGKITDSSIVFLKGLSGNEHLFYQALKGFGDSSKDYVIRVENRNTGAAVRITSDQPLAKLVFWSAPKTLCPEPFIHIKVEPGQTFEWNIYYQFYICGIINQ